MKQDKEKTTTLSLQQYKSVSRMLSQSLSRRISTWRREGSLSSTHLPPKLFHQLRVALLHLLSKLLASLETDICNSEVKQEQ
jgi:hypothetical protein